MNKNYIIIIFISYLLIGCGFKPIHKFNESGFNMADFKVTYNNSGSISYEVKDEINRLFYNEYDDHPYILDLNIEEGNTPLIINTNGTVAKYQIEILISFKVTNNDDDLILEGKVNGYSQYDVQTSEINNDATKKQMTRSATSEAMALIITKIQSSVVSLDDN